MSIRDNEKIFAFDIDGTILSSKGELINNIAPFIIRMKRAYPDAKFTFVTSGTASTARYAAKKIGEAWAASRKNAQNASYEQLNIDIAALGGSYIFKGTQNATSATMAFTEPTVSTPLSAAEIAIVSDVLKDERFAGTDILYYEKDRMIYTKAKIGKKRLITGLLKTAQSVKSGVTVLPNLEKKEFFDISPVSQQTLKDSMKNSGIYTLGLVNLSKETNKAMAKELTKRLTDTELNISPGTLLEVSHSNKWKTLNRLYGEDDKSVIYFGDGNNDRECLKKCRTSFALGKKLDVLKSGKYSIENFIDAIDICLSGEETTELKQKSEGLREAAEEKAEKKANNIRSKVKSALKSNKSKEMGM